MQVVYDSTRPRGVGQIMSVGAWDTPITSRIGAVILYGGIGAAIAYFTSKGAKLAGGGYADVSEAERRRMWLFAAIGAGVGLIGR